MEKTMYNPYIGLPYLAPTMDHAPAISSRRNKYCSNICIEGTFFNI
jgi:hypothetical protein